MQTKYEKPNASLCSWCRCSLSTTSSTSWWPCCWSSMWSGSPSSLPSLFRSKIYSWRNGCHCRFETLFLFSMCSVPTKRTLRTLSAKNDSDKHRHCFYFPGVLCRQRQHWGCAKWFRGRSRFRERQSSEREIKEKTATYKRAIPAFFRKLE